MLFSDCAHPTNSLDRWYTRRSARLARRKGKGIDTRAALLQAALELACERGFDGCSVDAIASRASLSKGTFFHFFRSKQALLDATCEQVAADAWSAVRPALEDTDHDPLTRLEQFFELSRNWRLENGRPLARLWRALSRDGNVALLAKVRLRHLELAQPAFVRLIAEGDAHGQFRVQDAETTAALVLEWVTTSAEQDVMTLMDGRKDAAGAALRRLNQTLAAVERILGAGEGVLRRVGRESLEGDRDGSRARAKSLSPGTQAPIKQVTRA